MDKVKLGEGEMDGVAFQHLDDGAFEQANVRPCNNVTRAAVEDEQQWGWNSADAVKKRRWNWRGNRSASYQPSPPTPVPTAENSSYKGSTISTSIAKESS